jgi:thioredoxin-like negative regulator of GroEL
MSARTTASPQRTHAATGRRTASGKARPASGKARPKKPILLFFTRTTSGPARRMESLIAWIKVTQRNRIDVVAVDIDRHQKLARRLQVADVPALVLVAGGRAVGRIDGRATGHEIDRMIDPYLS